MRTFRDAKAMARSLRDALGEKSHEISHSDALELIAAQFEAKDWNVLAAQIDAHKQTDGIHFAVALPRLRIFDVDKAMEFYRDFLGFSIDWEHRFGPKFPLYCQISRAGFRLHLTEHHGDASPGAAVYIEMSGIKAFHTELLEKSYRFARPGLETTEWKSLEVLVTDPFGNRLTFAEASVE